MTGSGNGRLPRWRVLLDGAASLSLVVVCSVAAWRLATADSFSALIPPVAQAPVAPLRLQGSATPPGATSLPAAEISIEGASLGKSDASVIVLNFTDFQCPYCAAFFRTTLPQLKQDYIDRGKVLFVVKHLPLESIHPNAASAAEAAECANRQGRFWDMHDLLFADRSALDPKSIQSYADRLALGSPFQTCMDGAAKETVRADVKLARDLGISGTPAFLIGVPEKPKQMRVLARLTGAAPFERFKAEIDRIGSMTKRPPTTP